MKFFLFQIQLIVLFLLYSLTSQAQSRFSVRGIVDLGSSYRNIKILDEPSNRQLAKQVKEKRDITENPALAYSFGVLGSYRLHQNLTISTGAVYKSLATFTPRIPNCWPGPAPNCHGLWVSQFPGSMYHEVNARWNYLSVPLLIKLSSPINDSAKVGYVMEVGPSVDLLLNQKERIREWDANENTHFTRQSLTDWFNPVIFSLQGSAGITYRFNKKHKVGLSVYYNHSLSPIVENSGWFKETMYSYGVRLSINRNI